jgi:hypothetical protein
MPRLGFAAVSFTALYTDPEGADLRESTRLLEGAGFRVVIADAHSEEEVIARVSDSQPEALLPYASIHGSWSHLTRAFYSSRALSRYILRPNTPVNSQALGAEMRDSRYGRGWVR